MERFKVGIIGAGHIARKMAHTLRDMEAVSYTHLTLPTKLEV